MKKRLCIVLAGILCLTLLCACGSTEGAAPVGADGQAKAGAAAKSDTPAKSRGTLTAGDLDISQFPWEVSQGIYQGERIYALHVDNDSPYPLIGVQLDYCVKDGITDAELALFDGFRAEHDSFIEEDDDGHELILRGERLGYAAPGGALDGIGIAIGFGRYAWYDVPNEEQFSVMQPDILTLALVGKDDRVYAAYYDCKSGKWSVEDSGSECNNWFETELSALAEKPECDLYRVTSGKTSSYFSFDAYGLPDGYYDTYVDKLKTLGFSVDPSEYDDWYRAKNADGYTVSLDFDRDADSLSLTLHEP